MCVVEYMQLIGSCAGMTAVLHDQLDTQTYNMGLPSSEKQILENHAVFIGYNQTSDASLQPSAWGWTTPGYMATIE